MDAQNKNHVCVAAFDLDCLPASIDLWLLDVMLSIPNRFNRHSE